VELNVDRGGEHASSLQRAIAGANDEAAAGDLLSV
jgi:hypothetical protein